MMPLGKQQELFVRLQADWIVWVLSHPGVALRPGESRILPLGPSGKGRRALDIATGKEVLVQDTVHMTGGCHYLGLAADWNLFVKDEWISDGTHALWQIIGEKWESMHALCRWGGRFGDANHISLERGGKK